MPRVTCFGDWKNKEETVLELSRWFFRSAMDEDLFRSG